MGPPVLLLHLAVIVMAAASATGLDPISPVPASTPLQSIDLLSTLGLYNDTWMGVTLTPGPQPLTRAYHLQGAERELRAPAMGARAAAELLQTSAEFALSAWLRQDEGNVGTVVCFGGGAPQGAPAAPARLLELQSSGKRGEVRLFYTSRIDNKMYTETFPYKLDDGLWHHVLVSVSGSQVDFFVDCHPVYKRMLRPGAPDRANFTELWLGQRYKHFYFKGTVQDVRLVGGPHGHLTVCPALDSTCPTCGQFAHLQGAVQDLRARLQDLSERLMDAESRLGKVEQCDCEISCYVNGTRHADGATWQRDCDLCACVHGQIQCRPVDCPKPMCKHPVKKPGQCCEDCLNVCMLDRKLYDHGEVVSVHKCRECECNDGTMNCKAIDPSTCPPLNCPPEQQFSVTDNCCKFCPGVDYCAKGHFCHSNATCVNLQTTYACQCDRGFRGDGKTCTDVDECQQEGGPEGHHCNRNTQCVNTNGSYICECLPGYARIDKYNCAELDECSSGEHNCDLNADCINTKGSYHCQCKDGYSGDGYKCDPICERKCLNGGTCRSPGKCQCLPGYTGPSCERDLDECATNTHRCTNSSTCVNMIGWYYCRCKDGYMGPRDRDNNHLGQLCVDVDECEVRLATCHPSSRCVNTDGGYRCDCPPSEPACRRSCVTPLGELEDGGVRAHADTCVECACAGGVLSCAKRRCDCAAPGAADDRCCPDCRAEYGCRHQQFGDVLLRHGERWSFNCQTCECEYGQIDCFDLACPPLTCDKPVVNPDGCCPYCADTCDGQRGGGASGAPNASCSFAGRQVGSGQTFDDPNDPCVTCDCKDGVLCCSVNNNCNRTLGFDGLAADAPAPTADGRAAAAAAVGGGALVAGGGAGAAPAPAGD